MIFPLVAWDSRKFLFHNVKRACIVSNASHPVACSCCSKLVMLVSCNFGAYFTCVFTLLTTQLYFVVFTLLSMVYAIPLIFSSHSYVRICTLPIPMGFFGASFHSNFLLSKFTNSLRHILKRFIISEKWLLLVISGCCRLNWALFQCDSDILAVLVYFILEPWL